MYIEFSFYGIKNTRKSCLNEDDWNLHRLPMRTQFQLIQQLPTRDHVKNVSNKVGMFVPQKHVH